MSKRVKLIGGLAAVVIAIAALLVGAFPKQQNAIAGVNNGYYGPKAKYVFYFIGDGMAMPQIGSTEILKGTINSTNKMNRGKISFACFPNMGMQTSNSADTFVTDSAAAGTALATGHKTNNEVLGMDSSKTKKLKSIAEFAKEQGKKVGIVTSVSLDHATPGAFYAHQPTRQNYYEIGQALIHSGFNYFAGGGLLAPTGKHKDQPNLFELAKQNGYQVANSKEAILNVSGDKVIAVNPSLAADQAMQYAVDKNVDQPLGLDDLTKKGIELLDNENGFFMMVEGGKIDWACHANDAATTMHEVLAFEKAINEALKFYALHPNETLIVVTGDHETGGMSIGFSGTHYSTSFSQLNNQNVSFERFTNMVKEYRQTINPEEASLEDWLPLLQEDFGLAELTDNERIRLNNALKASMENKKSKDEESYRLYGPYEPFVVTITHILNEKAGIGWTTYSHSGLVVPVFAQGLGGELFQGYYDNTDIPKKIMNVMGLAYSE